MMNGSLTLQELRDLMARMESKQDKVRKRWKIVVAEFSEIEEAILRIDRGASGKAGGKRARLIDVSLTPATPKRRGRRKKAGPALESLAAATLPEPAKIEAPAGPEEPGIAGDFPPTDQGRPSTPPAPQPAPKRRGRPRKSEIPAGENPHAAPLPGQAEMLPSSATPPKRRGRPKKEAIIAPPEPPAADSSADSPDEDPRPPEASAAPPHAEAQNPEPPPSAEPAPIDLTESLIRILREAGKAMSFEELASAAERAGFGGENLEESVQRSILNGPFRETVGGLMLEKPASPSKPLASLLDE